VIHRLQFKICLLKQGVSVLMLLKTDQKLKKQQKNLENRGLKVFCDFSDRSGYL